MDSSELKYVGNKAVIELYDALIARNVLDADAAKIVGQVYESCGSYGHLPANQ